VFAIPGSSFFVKSYVWLQLNSQIKQFEAQPVLEPLSVAMTFLALLPAAHGMPHWCSQFTGLAASVCWREPIELLF
jgi:hypothetical protein